MKRWNCRCNHEGCKTRFDRWHSVHDWWMKLNNHYCRECQRVFCVKHTRISPHGPRGQCGLDSNCYCYTCFSSLSSESKRKLEERNKLRFGPLASTSEHSFGWQQRVSLHWQPAVGIRRCQNGAACCFWFTMFGLFEPIVLLLCTEYFHNWIAVTSSSILKLMGWQLGENLSLIRWWNTIKANSWNGDYRLQKCCLRQSVALSAIHTLVNICNQVLSIWFVSLQYVESRFLESTNSSQLWTFSRLRKRVLRNWCRISEKWWWRWNTPPFADFCRMFGVIQTAKIPLRQCGKLTNHSCTMNNRCKMFSPGLRFFLDAMEVLTSLVCVQDALMVVISFLIGWHEMPCNIGDPDLVILSLPEYFSISIPFMKLNRMPV